MQPAVRTRLREHADGQRAKGGEQCEVQAVPRQRRAAYPRPAVISISRELAATIVVGAMTYRPSVLVADAKGVGELARGREVREQMQPLRLGAEGDCDHASKAGHHLLRNAVGRPAAKGIRQVVGTLLGPGDELRGLHEAAEQPHARIVELQVGLDARAPKGTEERCVVGRLRLVVAHVTDGREQDHAKVEHALALALGWAVLEVRAHVLHEAATVVAPHGV